MKRIRQSTLLALGLILTACLLAGATAGGHVEKKCYNSSGDEIPCPNSNYSETQFAARATARKSGPTVAPVAASWTPSPIPSTTPSPTPSPVGTSTSMVAPTQAAMPTLMQAQQAAPPPASAAQAASSRPSAIGLVFIVVVIGLAGLIVVILLFMIFRWLSSRRNTPPGPTN